MLYLRDRTGFFKDRLKVLDIAPMKIFQKQCKALANIDYVSADVTGEPASVRSDLTAIAFSDNRFDCIFCYHVLEHIQEDTKAMRELFRVLKPGGWAIPQVPIDWERDKTLEDPAIVTPEQRECFYRQFDHVRLYGRDYKDRLEEAGFDVKLDDYAQTLDDKVIEKYGLKKGEIIFFCTKPAGR